MPKFIKFTAFLLSFTIILIIFNAFSAAPVLAANITAHYIKWQFIAYTKPDFMAEQRGVFNPQTVTVLVKNDTGWAMIKTYIGDLWVYLESNKRHIDKNTMLFDNKGDKNAIAVIDDPQTVKIIEQDEDWFKIETWLGPKWIDLSPKPPQQNQSAPDQPKPVPANIKNNANTINITDNKKRNWYFIRNKNNPHTPPGSQTEINLAEYNAYYLGDTSQNKVYFTFDCGYENGYTPAILDILKANDIKAAFFVTNHFINANPELCKRMIEEGHTVGNHTASHPTMPNLSEEKIRWEIQITEDNFLAKTGCVMDKYFRPPNGEYSQKVLYIAMDMGYRTVFWSFAYLDWDVKAQPSKSAAYNTMVESSHPGAIYLIHNISKTNAEVLDSVIRQLKQDGYSFAELSEIEY